MILENKKSRRVQSLTQIREQMKSCLLCGRKCAVDRSRGEKGFCGAGIDPVVFTYMAHKGEEPPISGSRGSGTIFFAGCSMGCVYCQNYKFSQHLKGIKYSSEDLAGLMLNLQKMGCHNINLVNPTHFVPGIALALECAFSAGLSIPIVYNSGGYDSDVSLSMIEGLTDVYLPDMRYSSNAAATIYSSAPSYVDVNRKAVLEMFRQTGSLKTSGRYAVKGTIIRLLILPEDISGLKRTLKFIATNIGHDIHISLMSQYYPAHQARYSDKLNRRINSYEYDRAVGMLRCFGFENGWIQPFGSEFDKDLAGESFQASQ